MITVSWLFNYHGRFESDELIATFGNVVPEYSCPFNGILLSRKLVDKIGYPIPQLFIWGMKEIIH